MTTETRPESDLPAIAPDGSVAAIKSGFLGGFEIGWDRLLTTVPIYIGLIIIWLYFDSQTAGLFIGARNLSEMAQEYSYEAVLAIGVVFVLLLGEIDLSLGYLTLLGVAILGSLSGLESWSPGTAIAATVIACTFCGLCQGLLVAWVRMPSFVVTLGGFLIFEGIAYHILAGSTIAVYDPFIDSLGTYYLPNALSWIIAAAVVALYLVASVLRQRARAKAGLPLTPVARTALIAVALAVGATIIVATLNSYRGVPVVLAILFAFVALMALFATRLPLGRHVYAVGGNLEAARRAGINTTAVKWIVFGISGMFAGIAATLLVGQTAAASSTTAGPDLLLDIISIAVIGGVSLTGGKGSVKGVLIGGLVIASLDSGLNLMNTDPYYVYVIKGAILLAAIGIDVVGKRWGDVQWFRRRGAVS